MVMNTKFEQRGVTFQYEANSKPEAIKAFKRSCTVCCYKGIHIDCDYCSIKVAHEDVMAILDDIEKNKRNQK